MVPVFLGLGSNKSFISSDKTLLDPPTILYFAYKQLSILLSSIQVSSIYITKAMYVTDQDDFYNMAVSGYFSGTPYQLLAETQRIEATFGRDRTKEYRNGPRTLDIDIEIFDEISIHTQDLQVPHPRLEERAFILVPLLEILPKDADTAKRKHLEDCLSKLPDQGVHLYGKINSCGKY